MKYWISALVLLLAFSPAYFIVSLVYLYHSVANFVAIGRNFETVSVLFLNCIITSFLGLICYACYGHFVAKKSATS